MGASSTARSRSFLAFSISCLAFHAWLRRRNDSARPGSISIDLSKSAKASSRWIGRLQADRRTGVGQRFVELASFDPDHAAIAVGRPFIRIQAQGFLVIGQGAVRLPLLLETRSAVTDRQGVPRIESNGLGAV